MTITKAVTITSLFCFTFSLISLATPNMITHHYQFNNENQLNDSFSHPINTFWENHAVSSNFNGVDNKKIHTVSIRSGNNKAIVISQGRNESVLKYKEVAYDLNNQGYDLFLIDHRGQGFSERLGGDQYRGHVQDFQDYAQDLHSYITSLNLSKHYQYNYLLSHSMGGTINALYLATYSHPFQAASFISPMFSINLAGIPNGIAKILTYTSAEICSWFSDTPCYIFAGKDYSPKSFKNNDITTSEVRFNASQNTFIDYPETQLGSPTMRWVAESISAGEQAISQASNISIPVLIIQAGNDTVVTSAGQTDFFDNIKHCVKKQIVNISGAQHELLLESDKYRIPALNNSLNFFKESQQGEQTCIK